MSPRILVAEDNPVNLELIRQLLEEEGCELLAAADGEEAIRLALEHRPDLILMDLSLPRVDGWEATRRLRADPRTAAIPVVALTAHAIVGYRERALAAGCTDYLTKPVDEDALFAVIRRLTGAAADAPSPRPPSLPNPAVLAAVREHLPRLLEEARRAHGRGDAHALCGVAHQLKGGAQMAALLEIGALAGELEEAAGRGDLALAGGRLAAIEALAAAAFP